MYKVIDYVNGNYVTELYRNVYDINPVVLRMSKWKFDEWRLGKWDKTDIDVRGLIPREQKTFVIKYKDSKNNKVGEEIEIKNINNKLNIILQGIESMNYKIAKMQEQIDNLQDKTKEKIKFVLDEKEQNIIDFVVTMVEKYSYIVEADVRLEDCSKALIQKTIRNIELLDSLELQRIRANKEIKEKLGIDLATYPFIIVKKE